MWLERHFPHIPSKNVFHCARKDLVRCDVLVDDGVHNFDNLNAHGVLFDQPWNRAFHSDGIPRLANWIDLGEYLLEYAAHYPLSIAREATRAVCRPRFPLAIHHPFQAVCAPRAARA